MVTTPVIVGVMGMVMMFIKIVILSVMMVVKRLRNAQSSRVSVESGVAVEEG